VSQLKISDEAIKSAEGVVIYLTKYLAKSFQMRNNRELAAKTGLLPNMRIYQSFQNIYDYRKSKKYRLTEKSHKPRRYSYAFINNDYGYVKQVEKDFGNYFAENSKLGKNIKQNLIEGSEDEFTWQTKKN
jgi:hypothetical protein